VEGIDAMKTNKILPLSIVGSLVITTLAADCREPLHTELRQHQEAPTLTMFVNSTATFTSYRPFSFYDGFDQFT
jgi:hypothetical protein